MTHTPWNKTAAAWLLVVMAGLLSDVAAAGGEVEPVATFEHLRQRIDAGRPITVAYLGGSITEGAMCWPLQGVNREDKEYDYAALADREKYSWRARSYAWLKEHYEKRPGQFRMIDAAVGATHSELAAYRLEHNVLRYRPDLIFIEFAINDAGKAEISNDPAADNSIYRTMSSIVTRLRQQNPDIAIFVCISTARDLDATAEHGQALSRRHHRHLAERLRVPYADIHEAFYVDPLPAGITRDNVFDGPDEPGCNVHPSPLGHQVYAEKVCGVLERLLTTHAFTFSGSAAAPYAPYPYQPQFVPAAMLPALPGWRLEHNTEYETPAHVLHAQPALVTEQDGVELEMVFTGRSVFIWGQHHFPRRGETAGRLEVFIDDQRRAVFVDEAHRQGRESRLTRLMPVANDLDLTRQHTLRLRATATAPEEPVRIGLHGIAFDRGPTTRVESYVGGQPQP